MMTMMAMMIGTHYDRTDDNNYDDNDYENVPRVQVINLSDASRRCSLAQN